MINTKMGVVEFKVPANELFNLLPTQENIKAGKRFPRMPMPKSHLNLSIGIVFMPLNTQGSKKTEAKNTRPAPSSTGVRTTTIFLINRNDSPQMIAKKTRMPQA